MGQTRKMYSVLEDLVTLDRNRVRKDMPWAFKKLGDLAWNFHLDPIAAKWYVEYLELVPDDPDREKMIELIDLWKDKEYTPKPME